jgi:hypothetical protein
MAQKTREELNAANAALFVNNETGDITPDEERAFNEDVNDSAVNIKGDTFASGAIYSFQNNSKLREGIIQHGYGGGIAKVCANDKTDQWEDGFRYLIQTSGSTNTVVYVENMNGTNPGDNDDETKSYVVGSRWRNLVTGIEYVCTQANEGDAIWVDQNIAVYQFDVTITDTAAIQGMATNPIPLVEDDGVSYLQLIAATILVNNDGTTNYDFTGYGGIISTNGGNFRAFSASYEIDNVIGSVTITRNLITEPSTYNLQLYTRTSQNDNSGGLALSAFGADATEGDHTLRVYGTYTKFPIS